MCDLTAVNARDRKWALDTGSDLNMPCFAAADIVIDIEASAGILKSYTPTTLFAKSTNDPSSSDAWSINISLSNEGDWLIDVEIEGTYAYTSRSFTASGEQSGSTINFTQTDGQGDLTIKLSSSREQIDVSASWIPIDLAFYRQNKI